MKATRALLTKSKEKNIYLIHQHYILSDFCVFFLSPFLTPVYLFSVKIVGSVDVGTRRELRSMAQLFYQMGDELNAISSSSDPIIPAVKKLLKSLPVRWDTASILHTWFVSGLYVMEQDFYFGCSVNNFTFYINTSQFLIRISKFWPKISSFLIKMSKI